MNYGLIIDNFAGGGGASTGIELALGGHPVDYAINHDPVSIAMHQANHPHTKHLCEDVFAVNPVSICGGRPVDLAWFSPDCKHFSKAKGGKPRDKHIRGLAWVAIKWAKAVRPKVIMLENVEEFKTWGPLDENGDPIKEKAGSTFRKFVKELENLGYVVEFRELIAADYGAPTKRKRFFMVARCDGKPIIWPEKTYAEKGKCQPGQRPWRSAASIIDFALPTKSIFKREKELAEPTKKRIGRGLEKFVLTSADPFIIPVGYGEAKGQSPRCNSIKEPVSTVVSSIKQNVVIPYYQDAQFMKSQTRRLLNLNEPTPTISAGGNHLELSEAKLSPFMGLNNFLDGGRSAQKPLATITQCNKETLLAPKLLPFLSQNYGGSYKGNGCPLTHPCPTVTAFDHNRIIFPKILPFIGVNNFGNKGADAEKPLPVITSAPSKNVLLSPVITDYKFSNDGSRADSPMPTETAVRSHCLTAPLLCEYYGNSKEAVRADKPLPTVTGKDRHALSSAFIQEYYGGFYKGNGAKINQPLPTATTKPRFWIVDVSLSKEDEETLGNWHFVRDFINQYTTVKVGEGQMLLIKVEGRDYFISDIGMRMLTPRELYDAQGFPHDYVIDRDCNGKAYPSSKQVARCGNAVPPPFAEALVRSNLPELCPSKKVPSMKALEILQDAFDVEKLLYGEQSSNGQMSIFSNFKAIKKQVKEERKGSMGGEK